MEIVIQPYKSKICGHCCVAMVAGVPVERVVEFIGHTKGTITRELVKALRHFGKEPASNRLVPCRGKLPAFCILKTPLPNTKNWHWVVYKEGAVFCPSSGIWPYEEYASKASSYLEIKSPI